VTDRGRKGLVATPPQESDALDEEAWYLGLPENSRTLQMVDGRHAPEMAARGALYGLVLFLARPPVKEHVAATTSELLQV
jgi:hypothetical protein